MKDTKKYLMVLFVCLNVSLTISHAMEDQTEDQKEKLHVVALHRLTVVENIKTSEPGAINRISDDGVRLLFEETSKVTNPGLLTFVCKHWYSICMAEDPQKKRPNSTMKTPYLEKYMEIFWTSRFYNGVLRY